MGKDLKGNELGKGFSQRKGGRYEARATIDGMKIHIYSMDLSDLRKRFEEEKLRVLASTISSGHKTLLNTWFEEWFTTCKSLHLKNDRSRQIYRRKVKNTFVRILGEKPLENITQIDIQNAANQLVDENYTVRSIKEAIGALKECFEIAVINRLIPVNPCQQIYIKNGCISRKPKRILDDWERRVFLGEIQGDYYDEAYQILLLTGMRIGEFSGLQWEDIDFTSKVINIQRSMTTSYLKGEKVEELTTPKTYNSYRTIPFFDNVESLLLAWREKQNIYRKQRGSQWRLDKKFGNLVFTNTMGSPVTRYVLSHDIDRVVRNINMKEMRVALLEHRQPREFKHLHPHAFRHTFATICFEKKMDPIFIQNIMGHSDYSTTLEYTHILPSLAKNESLKSNNFLLGENA